MQHHLARWLPFALFLVFVAGIILCADRGSLDAMLGWINHYPFFDKAGHLVLIGTLALLLNFALRGRTIGIGPARIQLGGLIIAAAITLEEFSQVWFPSRNFDYADLAANYLGILLADLVFRVGRRMRPRSAKP